MEEAEGETTPTATPTITAIEWQVDGDDRVVALYLNPYSDRIALLNSPLETCPIPSISFLEELVSRHPEEKALVRKVTRITKDWKFPEEEKRAT
ncbi:hypothetical protein [Thermococcus celericrescens]|uniref:hypothetical protein n=1 Tax=Thermococcus celericrescens TaxID=227598 RepID=UPI0009F90C36|nr:hypothetical protein [Thermococcus celericrescens]